MDPASYCGRQVCQTAAKVAAPGRCGPRLAPAREFPLPWHARNPDAQGINFKICAGAVPPGVLFYHIACGPQVQVDQAICLDGAGPHILTFCKPGNNTNQNCITSIPAPSAGPGITLNDGCTGTITSTGFAPGTITWTSVEPGPAGAYDSYLACHTCPHTTVTGQTGAPAYVDYQVWVRFVDGKEDLRMGDVTLFR